MIPLRKKVHQHLRTRPKGGAHYGTMPMRSKAQEGGRGNKDQNIREQGATATKILVPSSRPPLALESSKRNKDNITIGVEGMSTPNRTIQKAPCPQGSLPMAQDEESLVLDDMELNTEEEEESKTKSDPKESDDKVGSGDGEDKDSIGRAIAGTRKNLFKVDETCTPGGKEESGEKARKPKGWTPIPKAATTATPQGKAQTSGRKGAKFAEGTQFHEKVSTGGAKKTPGKEGKMNNCIVRIKLKLTGGHKDIPASIMGMINHSLSILQERVKKACYLNRKKSLEASKAADFPKDFTDFYDDWGIWDERIKAFANNIPTDKSRLFSVLFNFRSKWDPAALLEKTSLKMATQTKHKGAMRVEMKPCQCLDTVPDIIFFNPPFCNPIGLRDFIRQALTKQKSALIKRHPLKYPWMGWGQHLPEFEMVGDFVKNTPWRSREEKSTIQAFHKIAWHLECPWDQVDFFYTLIKVMKKNKSLYPLLGYSITVTKKPGPDALPGLRMKLAQVVHWHTSFQMLINHAPLRGLVDPDKLVELHRMKDKKGDPQESVFTSVRGVMSKHKINHLPLWQAILQNDDGSWKGFHLNGQGYKAHKRVASRWLGCVSMHLRFHLLKRGVTEDSTLALIRASFSQQVLWDAINATMKDGKVVSATQAEFNDELDNMMCKATWVDITKGMELSKRVEYEQESRGRAFMLDPNNPKALNFTDKQSDKLLNTAVTGGLVYTMAFLVSLGETAYMPMEDDIDSQETNVFKQDIVDSNEDEIDNEGVITNLVDIKQLSGKGAPQQPKEMAVNNKEDEDEVQVVDTNVDMFHSPKKLTRTAMAHSGILKEMTKDQRDTITSMVEEWTADHKDEPLPPQLAALAAHAGLVLGKVASTPSRRGEKDKVKVDTPSASEGAITDYLKGIRFVLSGT